MDLSKLEERIRNNLYSAGNCYWDTLNYLEEVDGQLVPTNNSTPFSTLWENSVVQGVVNNNEIDKLHRFDSPEYAENFDELARHLPYQTLASIFATPCTIQMQMYLRLKDIQELGVSVSNRVKRVIIPRDTVITHRSGTTYGLLFDIEISVTDGVLVDAVYLDNNNPMKNLLSPVIRVSRLRERLTDYQLNEEIVELTIDVDQFKREVETSPVTVATGFSKTFPLTDQFYHARVFTRVQGVWIEFTTAFSDFIYDPRSTIPTAVVKHLGNMVSVTIPQIFLTNGNVGSEVKIEFYTTKGYQTVDYTQSTEGTWKVKFINQDASIQQYTVPLENFKDVFVITNGTFSGGSDMPDFETQRAQVVAGDIDNDPITELELQSRLRRAGFSYIHAANYLTENTYLAGKTLPLYQANSVEVMYPGGNIPVLLDTLRDIYGVIVNGDNTTITPNAIVRYENGQTNLLSDSDMAQLNNLPTNELLTELNEYRYLNPAFHYVVERLQTSNRLYVYHMRTPKVINRDFVGSNQDAEGAISISSIEVRYNEGAYKLTVRTLATSTYRELANTAFIAQLGVLSSTNQKLAMNHTTVERDDDGNYTFIFDISTLFDIRYGSGLKLSSLSTEYNEAGFIDLESRFEFSFNLVDELPVQLDTQWYLSVDKSKLPEYFQVVTLEAATVQLGYRVDALYCPVRTLPGQQGFKTYPADVMAYYQQDIYARDSAGNLIFTDNPDYDVNEPISETNPAFHYHKLHTKGDPIIVDGSHQVLHAAGTVMVDDSGIPIPDERNQPVIETSLICSDYRFSVAEIEATEAADNILATIESDINPLRVNMLQRSELFYSVSTTVGNITVRLDSETNAYIKREISLRFDVTVDPITYGEANTRALIESKIRKVCGQVINGATSFSANELVSKIDDEIADSVIGFRIVKVGDLDTPASFSVVNDGDVIGLAPKLEVDGSGQITITDDIDVNIVLESRA